jgi:hypothetical protein
LYAGASRGWGAIPALILTSACGLALVTVGDAMSRTGRANGQPVFWLGIALIVAPSAWRVTTSSATRTERIVLVVLVGLALYAVKIVHDPFGFTFADELVHQHNTNEILRTGSLFGDNSILPITSLYPGLEALTAALAAVTGMTTFSAGLIVVGAARVMIMLAIYLLVENLSSSTRAGAIGALFYAAGPNFLFFSGQYSYESLALPMSTAVVFAIVAMRSSEDARMSYGWGVLALLSIPAVAVTHHVSGYVLAGALSGLSIITVLLVRRRRRHPERARRAAGTATHDALALPIEPIATPEHLVADRTFGDTLARDHKTALIGAWRSAVGGTSHTDRAVYLPWIDRPTRFADEIIERAPTRRSWREVFSLSSREPYLLTCYTIVCVALWLIVVARTTTGYLSPVLSNAISLTFRAAAKDAPTRALFTSDAGTVSPLWEHVVVIASVLVLVVWLMFGLRLMWQRMFRDAVLLLLAVSAVLYLATLPLRVVPAAWESAIRASSFLFVGVALVAAQARPKQRQGGIGWIRLTVVGLSATIIVSGGIISGWPTNLRLASPYRLAVGSTTIDPPPTAAARWSKTALGQGNRIGAEPSDARLLLTYANQTAYAGVSPDIDDILNAAPLDSWQPELLKQQHFRFLLTDRRQVSSDVLSGYFFAPPRDGSLRPPEVISKFEHVPWADRVFDSGDLVLYDIHRLTDEQSPP